MSQNPHDFKTLDDLAPIERALDAAGRAHQQEPDAGFESRLLRHAPLGEPPAVLARLRPESRRVAWGGPRRLRLAALVGLSVSAGLLAWSVLRAGPAPTNSPELAALEAELDAWMAMGEALALPYRVELVALGAEADALFTLHTDPAAWAEDWSADWPWTEVPDDSAV